MGRFSQISQSAFNEIQIEAGMVLNHFDPDNPVFADENIVAMTTGGITASCVPQFTDYGKDIDNVPDNMKEMKKITSYDCTLGFTALNATAKQIKLGIGAADIAGNKITPRADLKQTDFSDEIWWVGDRADGGFVALKLMNALSTGGFSMQTTKNGKMNLAVTLTGHVSINAQKVVPMVFYVYQGSDDDLYSYVAITPAGTENPANSGWYERSGESGAYTYAPTTDTTVVESKTYYVRTIDAQDEG